MSCVLSAPLHFAHLPPGSVRRRNAGGFGMGLSSVGLVKVNWCELCGSCFLLLWPFCDTWKLQEVIHKNSFAAGWCTKGGVGRKLCQETITGMGKPSCVPPTAQKGVLSCWYWPNKPGCVVVAAPGLDPPSTPALTQVRDGCPSVWGLTLTPQITPQRTSPYSERQNLHAISASLVSALWLC